MAERTAPPRVGRTLCALAAACVAGPAAAQFAGWRVEPSFGLTEVVTDNADLSPDARRAEAITQVSTGVRLSGRSARLSGDLDYALNALAYARRSEDNAIQHALRASSRLEAVENHIFIQGEASIGQQTVSAFGAPTPDLRLASPNRRQTATASLQPTAIGRLGDLDVSARGNVARTRVQDSIVGDSGTETLALSVADNRSILGWGLDASYAHSAFAASGDSESRRLFASVFWRPDIDWRLVARAGMESDNGLGVRRNATSTWGLGATWTPSPRTSLDANLDDRAFGRSWNVVGQHRFRRSAIVITDSRNVSNGLALAPGRQTTLYALFFAQFASIEPDPVRRDALVRAYLNDAGLDPNAGLAVGGGFLAGTRTLDHRREIAATWSGVRTTLAASVSRSDSRRLGPVSAGDDLALVGRVRQQSYSVNASHRLTTDMLLSVSASSVRTLGEATAAAASYRLLSAGVSAPLGVRTSASLTVRHTQGQRPTGRYEENAATAVLGLRF